MNPIRPKTRSIPSLLLLATLLCPTGCAWLSETLAPPTMAPQEIVEMVSGLREQQKAVSTLYWTGTLYLDSEGSRSEASVLIVARRDPSAIRVEITHGWGRPLLHIQVEDDRLDVIAFSERRRYRGLVRDLPPVTDIPFPLDPDLIWSLARGYPILPPCRKAVSHRDHQIALLGEDGGAMQIIDFFPNRRPRKVQFCGRGTSMFFSDHREEDGIRYAGKVEVRDTPGSTTLTLFIREMVFNRPLPEAVFRQEVPPGFEVVTF